jgi:hypothetical protein
MNQWTVAATQPKHSLLCVYGKALLIFIENFVGMVVSSVILGDWY